MVRRRGRPSPTWRSFLRNQAAGIAAIDMFVVAQAGAPHLYRNVTPYGRNHWLEVAPVGTVSNRDGCGARRP